MLYTQHTAKTVYLQEVLSKIWRNRKRKVGVLVSSCQNKATWGLDGDIHSDRNNFPARESRNNKWKMRRSVDVLQFSFLLSTLNFFYRASFVTILKFACDLWCFNRSAMKRWTSERRSRSRKPWNEAQNLAENLFRGARHVGLIKKWTNSGKFFSWNLAWNSRSDKQTRTYRDTNDTNETNYDGIRLKKWIFRLISYCKFFLPPRIPMKKYNWMRLVSLKLVSEWIWNVSYPARAVTKIITSSCLNYFIFSQGYSLFIALF